MSCPHCHGECRHCPHHCPPEPTTTELIEKRDWKELDRRFGLLEHRGQTVILYAMLKNLIDRETAER